MSDSKLSRRAILKYLAAVAAEVPLAGKAMAAGQHVLSGGHTLAGGPFKPTWESLSNYQCPNWIHDAKFGIWAHWSAQCVPEQGDWYARNMYIQGSPDYEYHVKHYGHPSKVGFKDIDHIWRVKEWNPDELIRLYRGAGAKFFFALGAHCDNFDCWNSKYQEWNSVRVGPKKDIVGIWAKAARAHGLRFGVSMHAARAWAWFDVCHGSDKTGPLAGVPYDGNLTKADGTGQWWEGLDPAELYCKPHPVTSVGKPYYYSLGDPPEKYKRKFFNRTVDLIDQYHPDLLLLDDYELPFGDLGLGIAAHFYNSSIKWHGSNQAVLNTRITVKDHIHAVMTMVESGVQSDIQPYPWMTATCIGDWHYQRNITYRSPEQIVHLLVDVVSKNGVLALNIPLRGNGTIDDDEQRFLEGFTQWMETNGEAIYQTRPWKIYGEGPTRIRPGKLNPRAGSEQYTTADMRFTTKGNTLYAIAMAWPGERAVIRSLANNSSLASGTIRDVRLLGYKEKLAFTRNSEGLVIKLPQQAPGKHAFVFKIEGLELT